MGSLTDPALSLPDVVDADADNLASAGPPRLKRP